MNKKDRPVILPDLPDARIGEVCTRFPPEASGYMHLGHIKALLHNYLYAKKYQGKIILRFDDTNPDKEKEIYEIAIKEDIERLGLNCDVLTYASDYFKACDECAYQLLLKGLAYMDFSKDEEIGRQRAELRPSPYRDTDLETNKREFELLMTGEKTDGCLRAKIDYRNTNGCLRDPVLYRSKAIIHPRNPDRKSFPTYDFSCPILDKLQGITHAMRSIEYQGRDAQYKWFLKNIDFSLLTSSSSTSLTSSATSTSTTSTTSSTNSDQMLSKVMKTSDPVPMSYGKLNFTNTVLSKRKLGRLVEAGLTSGWDDPRMPTFRGIMRAGMQIEPLIAYITTQMLSKVPVTLEWSKIWSYNTTYLNVRAKRLYGIGSNIIEVRVDGAIPSSVTLQNHPQVPELGVRILQTSHVLLVDAEDFLPTETQVNRRYTLVGLGNAIITNVLPLTLTYMPEDRDFKTTTKITWLPKAAEGLLTHKVRVTKYGHLLKNPKLEDDDDVVAAFNQDSMQQSELIVEAAIDGIAEGETFQIMRKGYFYLDRKLGREFHLHGPF